jgi:clan AA aspartic protease
MPDNYESLDFPVIENFSPEVPVEIYGLEKNIKFVATVDTGSEGFLQIPLATGIKANLRLWGTKYWTLADGRKVKMLECIGRIRFAGKDLIGIISLSETSDACLLGMQFLDGLKMDFTVSLTRKRAIFQKLSEPEIKPEIKPNIEIERKNPQ